MYFLEYKASRPQYPMCKVIMAKSIATIAREMPGIIFHKETTRFPLGEMRLFEGELVERPHVATLIEDLHSWFDDAHQATGELHQDVSDAWKFAPEELIPYMTVAAGETFSRDSSTLQGYLNNRLYFTHSDGTLYFIDLNVYNHVPPPPDCSDINCTYPDDMFCLFLDDQGSWGRGRTVERVKDKFPVGEIEAKTLVPYKHCTYTKVFFRGKQILLHPSLHNLKDTKPPENKALQQRRQQLKELRDKKRKNFLENELPKLKKTLERMK